MNIDELKSSLHPLERKVIPFLKDHASFSTIIEKGKLLDVEVMRALHWLASKGVLELKEDVKEVLVLGENGKRSAKHGLPETAFLKSIKLHPKKKDDLKRDGLTDEEINACIGVLRQKAAITISEGPTFTITDHGKKLIEKESPEESLLKKILSHEVDTSKLIDLEKLAFDNLKKRKDMILAVLKKDWHITMTALGKELLKADLSDEYIEKVTPDLLATGAWKDKKFRAYDINAITPKLTAGRRHPLKVVMNKMRKIWLEMGFQEMEGPWVESAFWCMDSMWIPQDHPARDMQDTFYLPYQGVLPKDIAAKVSKEHESGGKCGSKGYGYTWDPELAKKLVLRTHTTATTFRKFGDGVTPPAKYFCIGRIFRNETVDATHLPEFHQIEGFVTGEGLTLQDLMGYIAEFYKKMGVTKIRFKPTYNPYTEPSMEASAYNEQLGKWVELINSGMFRPESLEPYGIKTPVIAWGLGVERLAMMVYQKNNLKEIFGPENDIDWLRNYKIPDTKK